MKSKSELASWITERIKEFFNKNPEMTQQQFSALTGISLTTINRYKAGKEELLPSRKTAFDFCSFFLSTEAECATFIKEVYPDWYESWYNYKGKRLVEVESNTVKLPKGVSLSASHLLAFSVCCLPEGATLDKLELICGRQKVDDVIDLLTEQNMIKFDGEKYFADNDTEFGDFETTLAFAKAYLDGFPIKEMLTKSALVFRTELVSEEERKEYFKVIHECCCKLEEIKLKYLNSEKKVKIFNMLVGCDWAMEEANV